MLSLIKTIKIFVSENLYNLVNIKYNRNIVKTHFIRNMEVFLSKKHHKNTTIIFLNTKINENSKILHRNFNFNKIKLEILKKGPRLKIYTRVRNLSDNFGIETGTRDSIPDDFIVAPSYKLIF